MNRAIMKRSMIFFYVSVFAIVLTVIFTFITYYRQAVSLKNKELLLIQSRTVESLSRLVLEKYILSRSENDNTEAINELDRQIEPRMRFMKEVVPVLEKGGSLLVDNLEMEYPPIPQEYGESVREIVELNSVFTRINNELKSGEVQNREKALSNLTDVMNRISEKSSAVYHEINRENLSSRRMMVIMIFASVLIILASFVYFYAMVVRKILTPLSEIIRVSSSVSDGDLTVFIPQPHYVRCFEELDCEKEDCPAHGNPNRACWRIEGTLCEDGTILNKHEKLERCGDCRVYKNAIKNEIDELIEATNNMIVYYKRLITEVQSMILDLDNNSDDLKNISVKLETDSENQASTFEEASSANEQLLASIENVAKSAREQAEKVGQTSASMEELSSTIQMVGKNSVNVSKSARETVGEAEQTEATLGNTTKTINQISESSQKIVDIISIINDISEQINLLSLNASIEAARAGEHGKGFAVVAEEISKLADATAQSTKEIETLINASRSDIDSGAALVNRTAEAINVMIRKIEESAQLIEEIAQSTDEQVKGSDQVMSDVEDINKMSEQIANITEEQKATSTEILKAVTQVNESIQEFIQVSQQISSSSQLIKNKTGSLRESISRFKV